MIRKVVTASGASGRSANVSERSFPAVQSGRSVSFESSKNMGSSSRRQMLKSSGSSRTGMNMSGDTMRSSSRTGATIAFEAINAINNGSRGTIIESSRSFIKTKGNPDAGRSSLPILKLRRDFVNSRRASVEDEFFWTPPPGEKPIKVEFQCACFNLSNVNTATLCAEIKFAIVLFWNDKRFIGSNLTTNDLPYDLWGPDITLQNALNDCCALYDSFSLIDPSTGRLKRTITFHGKVRNPMDIKQFPFDRDDFELEFRTNCNWRVLDGSRFGNDPVNRVYTLHQMKEKSFFHMGCPTDISEFIITGWSYHTHIPSKRDHNEMDAMEFQFNFHMVRNSFFYFLKIFFPLWLLVFTSAAAYTLPLEDLAGRYDFLTTVLLSLVGFIYIIQESIPKVGFLTIIDKVVILSLIVVVVSIFLSAGVAKTANLSYVMGRKFNIIVVFLNQGIYVMGNLVLILPAHRRSQRSKEEGIIKVSKYLNNNTISMEHRKSCSGRSTFLEEAGISVGSMDKV